MQRTKNYHVGGYHHKKATLRLVKGKNPTICAHRKRDQMRVLQKFASMVFWKKFGSLLKCGLVVPF